MEQEKPLTIISDIEKQALIQRSWEEKKGRLVGSHSPYALFVPLDNPLPNLAMVTLDMLEALDKNPRVSEYWAKTWGKVVVCVGPKSRHNIFIGEVEDDRNRAFVPVTTNLKIIPESLADNLPEGAAGKIILNNTPTTPEAIVISFVHMLDELIWDLYQGKLKMAGLSASPKLYQESLAEVRSKGFSLYFAGAEEILAEAKDNPNVSIRLYGSGVNKDVQRVIGAVIISDGQSLSEGSYSNKLADIISQTEPEEPEEDELREEIEAGICKPTVITSVTLGKELHAGHMLLLATADLVRLGLNVDEPLVLLNNNTGPRAAGALVSISRQLDISVEQAALSLSKDCLPADNIAFAYRTRVDDKTVISQVLKLLDEGRYDIFAPMVRRIKRRLEEAGFNVNVISETAGILQREVLLNRLNPTWYGSGFSFLDLGKSLKIVQKSGSLTATGKAAASLLEISKPFEQSNQSPFLIFVDSAPDATDAVAVYSATARSGRAVQLAGAGIGFRGEIASGSKGEALTLTDLLDEFSENSPGGSLLDALRQLILARPVLVPYVKSPNLANAFYDYRDNKSLVSDLIRCQEESRIFRNATINLMDGLRRKIGNQSKTTDTKAEGYLKYLPKKMLQASAKEVLVSMSKVRVLGMSGEYRKLEYGLGRFMPKDKVIKILIPSLVNGITLASDITEVARANGANLPPVLFGNDFEVRSEIIDAILKQGYAGDQAVNRVIDYMDGPKGLAVRDNYYLKIIKAISGVESMIESLSAGDFVMLESLLLTSLKRLGYEQ